MTDKQISVEVVSSAQHTITLKWTVEMDHDQLENLAYKVQIKDAVYKWITKYWGLAKQATIKELAPGHVYTIKIGMAKDSGEEIWSENITAATKCDFKESQIFCSSEFANLKNSSLDVEPKLKQIFRNRAIQAVNKFGETPLMQAARLGKINCMKLLLNAGSDPNSKMFPSLQTPLMAACFAGHKDVAELLVSYGANWLEKDICGRDALHYALTNSQLETVQMALKGGCGVNARDNYNWTPLMRAVILGASDDILTELLSHGGDVQLRDEHNQTCIDMAYLYKNENIIMLVTKRDEEEIMYEGKDRLISDTNITEELKDAEGT